MARYQRDRDEAAMPMFELTCLFANLEEPHPLVARGEAVLSETVQLIRST